MRVMSNYWSTLIKENCVVKPLFFILLTLALLTGSCKKDRLPNFYFQCKVDGVFYEPDNCANCSTKDLVGDTSLILGAASGNESLAIGLIRSSKISTGIYILANPNSSYSAIYDNTIGNPSDIFRTDSIRTGIINITELNRSNKIIEGTFYFDAFNIPKNKIVRVTEGRFRLNYRVY